MQRSPLQEKEMGKSNMYVHTMYVWATAKKANAFKKYTTIFSNIYTFLKIPN